jgi:eukaryotic translation initiation factor 2C
MTSRISADILLKLGKGALIPLELCDVIPGQLAKLAVPEDKKAEFVRFSTMSPKNRLDLIRQGLQVRGLLDLF